MSPAPTGTRWWEAIGETLEMTWVLVAAGFLTVVRRVGVALVPAGFLAALLRDVARTELRTEDDFRADELLADLEVVLEAVGLLGAFLAAGFEADLTAVLEALLVDGLEAVRLAVLVDDDLVAEGFAAALVAVLAVVVVFLAVDGFLAVDALAVDFLAVVFLAVAFLAVDALVADALVVDALVVEVFRAAGFAVALEAVLAVLALVAVAFRAVVSAAGRLARLAAGRLPAERAAVVTSRSTCLASASRRLVTLSTSARVAELLS